MFVELVFNVCESELGAPDRNIEFAQDPRQRADMVFVSVGENDGANVLPVLSKIGNVGDDDVDAEQFCFREHQAGIDDNNVVSPAHGHAVHTELAQPAERNYVQFSRWHRNDDASTVRTAAVLWLGSGQALTGKVPALPTLIDCD